jgi:hypothetical protein
MPNPYIVECPANTWTKVATAVKAGSIDILKTRPIYFQTYRLTDELAPVTAQKDEGVQMSKKGEIINSGEIIDIYIWPTKNGRVRVNV